MDDLKLTTTLLGSRGIEYHPVIDSTNLRAKQLIASGAPEGTLVIADRQTAGRGRFGRHWHSPAGKNIYISTILSPEPSVGAPPLVTLAAGLAVAETIRRTTQIRPTIKWPNDLLISNHKVAGILAELVIGSEGDPFVVLGIGLNVNLEQADIPEDLKDRCGSLRLATGKTYDRKNILSVMLEKLEEKFFLLKSGRSDSILQDYRDHCGMIGSKISIDSGHRIVTALAVDIDDQGRLVLEESDGSRRFSVAAGEVTIVKD